VVEATSGIGTIVRRALDRNPADTLLPLPTKASGLDCFRILPEWTAAGMERFGPRAHLMVMDRAASTTGIVRSDVELAADGDDVAFGRLIAAHHAEMMRLAYVITGEAALAQDAVQGAWIRAWQKLGSVRDPARVRNWLIAIAINEARQVARRRRQVRIVEIDAEISVAPRADPAASIARLDLVDALARLSPEDRALVALRYLHGLDAADLGAMTGRSASGTRVRLSRLMARLREELSDV
jgi:RNA polymerase sigma-70 factor (ECF subfamily)